MSREPVAWAHRYSCGCADILTVSVPPALCENHREPNLVKSVPLYAKPPEVGDWTPVEGVDFPIAEARYRRTGNGQTEFYALYDSDSIVPMGASPEVGKLVEALRACEESLRSRGEGTTNAFAQHV